MDIDRRLAVAGMLATTLAAGARGMTMTAPKTYAAFALQTPAHDISGEADKRGAMQRHIAAVTDKLRGSAAFVRQYSGTETRLAVLPEYVFTSYPGRVTIPDFARSTAWAMDGPEYDALGKAAQSLKLFVAGNAYETDSHFPDLYFQTSFVIAPSGDVVLRYRRLNSMYAPTPHDLWAKYLDIYGLDGVFPVAKTEIGNLAAIASEEILYPEIARAHALRGAEVFVHSSSEIGSPLPTPKAIAKRARAFENLAYVVSANTAGIAGTAMPLASADGNSMIVDWKGAVLAESNAGETFTAFADIDLAALRRARRKPGMTNFLARQRLELFAAAYAGTVQPADSLLKDGAVVVPEREHFARVQDQVIERLTKEGLI